MGFGFSAKPTGRRLAAMLEIAKGADISVAHIVDEHDQDIGFGGASVFSGGREWISRNREDE